MAGGPLFYREGVVITAAQGLPKKNRRTRRIDAANLSINITQLVAVVGLVWGAAMAFRDMTDRINAADARAVQLQSQVGETNARLKELERR